MTQPPQHDPVHAVNPAAEAEPTSTPPSDEYRTYTPREVRMVMTGLFLAMALAALDQTIVATALTTIVADLEGSSHLSWVVTAYLLTSTASAPLYGKLGDLYGRKRIFLFAIAVFLIGSWLCGIANSMPELIAFRAVQGLGAGGLFTLITAIIGDVVPPRDRGKYQSYFGAVWGSASVIGPVLGGFLTDSWNWRWVFYVNVPIGIVAVAFVATKLHLPKRTTRHRIDYLGALLLTNGVVCALLALVWGGGHPTQHVHGVEIPFTGYPWLSLQILGLAGLSLLFFGLFMLQERRHTEPILPLELFRDRVFTVSVLMSFLTGAAMFGAIIYLPQFLQIVKGYSPTESGLLMFPVQLGIMLTITYSGKRISKTGRYRLFPLVGWTLLVLSFFLFSTLTTMQDPWLLALYMLIAGAGMGLIMQISVIAVQNSVPFRHLGAATSAVLFFRTLGASVGTAGFGTVVNSVLRSDLSQHLESWQIVTVNLEQLQHDIILRYGSQIAQGVYGSYTTATNAAFLLGVPIAIAGLITAWLLPEKPFIKQQGK